MIGDVSDRVGCPLITYFFLKNTISMKSPTTLVGWLFCGCVAAADEMAVAGLALNTSTFYTTLHAPDAGRVFVLFFSPQCGHCAAMLPAWAELEQRTKGLARLAAVDATAEKALADRMDVHGFPTLLAVETGRIHEYDGGRSTEELLEFIRSTDLAAVSRTSRTLPRPPSPFDPVLRAPAALVEISAFALQTNLLAAALLAASLMSVGALVAMASRPMDAQFITVECPAGVAPGQTFRVEFTAGRRPLMPRGRRRVMDVAAPPGIVPGQTFFVPLIRPPQAQPLPESKQGARVKKSQ